MLALQFVGGICGIGIDVMLCNVTLCNVKFIKISVKVEILFYNIDFLLLLLAAAADLD
jgi:hypothetical protein